MRLLIRRFLAPFAAAMLLAAGPAFASPAEVARAIPNAQRVGEAHYRMLAIPLFHAELFATNGAFSWERPFALSLTYQRATRASALIDRAVREMSGRGAGEVRTLGQLRAQLESCLPDLARGDRITGVSTGADSARFYHNGARRCDVRWPGFRRQFFGIWLAGRDGPAAQLSAQLRGEA
jgi:hypothetical protein